MSVILLSLYGVLLVLNLLDGHSTWKVLRPSHLNRERNPLARWIFGKLGVLRGIIVAECLWISFITGVVLLIMGKRDPMLHMLLLALLIFADLIFLVVVLGNYRVLRRIRKTSTQAAGRSSSC